MAWDGHEESNPRCKARAASPSRPGRVVERAVHGVGLGAVHARRTRQTLREEARPAGTGFDSRLAAVLVSRVLDRTACRIGAARGFIDEGLPLGLQMMGTHLDDREVVEGVWGRIGRHAPVLARRSWGCNLQSSLS